MKIKLTKKELLDLISSHRDVLARITDLAEEHRYDTTKLQTQIHTLIQQTAAPIGPYATLARVPIEPHPEGNVRGSSEDQP
jgi:hypothetical protein